MLAWERTGKELLIAKQSVDGQEARINKNPLPALDYRCNVYHPLGSEWQRVQDISNLSKQVVVKK